MKNKIQRTQHWGGQAPVTIATLCQRGHVLKRSYYISNLQRSHIPAKLQRSFSDSSWSGNQQQSRLQQQQQQQQRIGIITGRAAVGWDDRGPGNTVRGGSGASRRRRPRTRHFPPPKKNAQSKMPQQFPPSLSPSLRLPPSLSLS